MKRTFLRFPGFKFKALTLSYDDGVRQDKRLISILDKYGIKATFNLNSGLFSQEKSDVEEGRMTKEEVLDLYLNSSHEVAVHGFKHLSLSEVDPAVATIDVVKDRSELEKLFGRIIKGMAYANGAYNDTVVDILKNSGISYCRTVVSTENFIIPEDWLRMPATCHHKNPKLMDLAKDFLEAPLANYSWSRNPRLFYLWGHSYEFDLDDNWNVIEDFAKFVGNRTDVWYATNIEIYNYVQAYDRLVFSIDLGFVYNPSSIDVYIEVFGKEILVKAGETVELSKIEHFVRRN